MGAIGVSFLGLPVENSWWGDFSLDLHWCYFVRGKLRVMLW